MVSTIEYTAPPENPRPGPHRSCMYWTIARLGSKAWAVGMEHAAASTASNNVERQRCCMPRSGEVFKFVNDYANGTYGMSAVSVPAGEPTKNFVDTTNNFVVRSCHAEIFQSADGRGTRNPAGVVGP